MDQVKRRDKIKHRLMAVTWIDSRRSSDWHTVTELLELPLAVITTVGYGYELEDKVVLASEYYRG